MPADLVKPVSVDSYSSSELSPIESKGTGLLIGIALASGVGSSTACVDSAALLSFRLSSNSYSLAQLYADSSAEIGYRGLFLASERMRDALTEVARTLLENEVDLDPDAQEALYINRRAMYVKG